MTFRPVSLVRQGLPLALAALGLAACSLAGDVTPPPGGRPVSLEQPAAAGAAPRVADVGYPLLAPSAERGWAVYVQHCLPCHGPEGRGGGSMTPQLPGPVPDFTDPALSRAASPEIWFRTVTDGRLDKFMPPFGDSLTELERWDAVSYLRTFSVSAVEIETGRAIYAEQCAACHGAAGGGGESPAGAATDLTDQAYVVTRSPQSFFDALDSEAHQFDPPLDQAGRWAASEYARSLAYTYVDRAALTAERAGSILGQIVNGTPGAAIPAGLEVRLHTFDGVSESIVMTSVVGAQGAYQFDSVAQVPGQQFIVSTIYQAVLYTSPLIEAGLTAAPSEAPITVFETTGELTGLAVSQMHLFVQFDSAEQVTVGQLYLITNGSERTYLGQSEQLLELPLPDGATEVTMEGGQPGVDYLLTPGGVALTMPIRPGPGAEVLLAYSLPYADGLEYSAASPLPIRSVNVILPDNGVRVEAERLADQGARDFQGTRLRTFTGQDLKAGDPLAFRLSGQPRAAGDPHVSAAAESSPGGLAIGLGSVGAVLLAVGVWLYRRTAADGGRAPAGPDEREALLQAIAELDDEFERGQLSEAEYARERRSLKADLQRIWKD